MTIRTKILSLVAAFALLAMAITALGIKTMVDYDRIIADYNHAADNAFRGERLNRYLSTGALEMRGLYLARDETEARFQADLIEARVTRLEAFLNDWQKTLAPGELPELGPVRRDCQNIIQGGRYMAQTVRTQGRAAVGTYADTYKYRLSREAMQARIDDMVTRIAEAQLRSQQAMERFKSERLTQFLIMAAGGVLLLLLGSMWVVIELLAAAPVYKRQTLPPPESVPETVMPEFEVLDGRIGELWRVLGVLKSSTGKAAQDKRVA
jgi:methyl-accepting chemotaxis protein